MTARGWATLAVMAAANALYVAFLFTASTPQTITAVVGLVIMLVLGRFASAEIVSARQAYLARRRNNG